MHPFVVPQINWPTVGLPLTAPVKFWSPNGTAVALDVYTCGTKTRLRLESAATECEPDDCGIVSIRTLVPSITPSTEPLLRGEPAGLIAALEAV